MRNVRWGRVLILVALLAFWAFLIWAAAPAAAATSPGQELADDTAEFIGETMKVPPTYRTLVSSAAPIVLNGSRMGGVVWCASSHETTIDAGVMASWDDLASTGLISDQHYAAVMVVFHEIAHRVSKECDFDTYYEEGATQAITLDLLPAWCRRFFGLSCSYPNGTYVNEVNYLRNQSAKATGSGWKTRAARLWRRAFYLSDRDTRRSMIPTRGGSL